MEAKHNYDLKIKKGSLLGIAAARGNGNTVYRIAENTDLHYPTMYNAINGVSYPAANTLVKVLLALGLSLDEIMQLRLSDIFTLQVDGQPYELKPAEERLKELAAKILLQN